MAEDALHKLTAWDLAQGFASGRFTPVDVVDDLQARIDEVNPTINAIIAENREETRRQAGRSAERWAGGAPLSPLDGVPVTVKDNLQVEGLPATWGSFLHYDGVRRLDEPALARLRAAGIIFLAKTNVPEFTLQGYTGNPVFGVTHNPLAPELTPGGSTGGGAAGVAAGFAPVAIGTDGGGSTRRPAAYCGLWGFKPSLGQIARSGGFPQILADFEVIGAIGRTARDVGAMVRLMAGWEPLDCRTLSAMAPCPPFPGAPRIGLFTSVGDAPVNQAQVDATETLADALGRQGARIERIEAPFIPERVNVAWGAIAQAGLAWHLSNHPGADAVIGENTRQMAEAGRQLTASDYVAAMTECLEIRGRSGPLFERHDILLCPTTAAPPWPAAQAYPTHIAGREVDARGHALFTTWVNVAGLCGASVPVRLTRDQGGIGAQLIAGHGRDRALLDFIESNPVLRTLRGYQPDQEIP